MDSEAENPRSIFSADNVQAASMIVRMGADKVGDHLPRLIQAIQREAAGCCGFRSYARQYHQRPPALPRPATSRYSPGKSARFFEVHQAEGGYRRRHHIEMTGQNITAVRRRFAIDHEDGLSDRATTPTATTG